MPSTWNATLGMPILAVCLFVVDAMHPKLNSYSNRSNNSNNSTNSNNNYNNISSYSKLWF